MTYQCMFIFLFTFLMSVTCDSLHPLNRRLSNWHTLKQSDIRLHRHKRSLNDDGDVIVPLDKQVSFDAFNRTFTLSLMPSPEILTRGFKAYTQNNNAIEEISIDKTSILTGRVMDDPDSYVTAHFDGKKLMANIETNNDTYVIEPMWRHLPKQQASSHGTQGDNEDDMLMYRQSDVNLLDYQDPHAQGGYCNTKELMQSLKQKQQKQDHKSIKDDQKQSHHRSKRSNGNNIKKICKLSLVADYRFYKEMGNNSTVETLYYLISLIERVNSIYKATDWDPESENGKYKGYGFQINRIKVHTEFSIGPDERYNQNRYWDARELLKAFSETNYSECLSHLFTYIDFPKGLLGLAYVGSPKEIDVGGICTRPFQDGDKTLYLNTGLTSTVNWNKRILTTEADLVTAHELGHNFGADHDDDTETLTNRRRTDCTPGQALGGNYIMSQAAVSGQYPNNKKFSVCSRHGILPTLLNKADLCFEEDNKSFCGDYKIDTAAGETCDVGLFNVNDPCCNANNCTLKRGAQCSNKNFPCCTDTCQVANATKLCRAHIPFLCHEDTYCDGNGLNCPEEEPVADGQECGESGECRKGKCEQYCTIRGKRPCLCDTPTEHQCVRCCANTTGEDCKPYRGKHDTEAMTMLAQNATCVLGYCNKGECQKLTQDVIERVWDIFQYIAPDKIGEFLADNIVGAVLVFSLLFWIPCSCLVNFVDKKRLRERQKEEKRWTERGMDYSRSFGAFRGVGGGSVPTTPRNRIQRNNANWGSGGVALNSGLNAREQWRASQERGAAMKKSRENLNERLAVVPGSPNDDIVLSHSQPSLANLTANGNNNRSVLSGTHSRSHPSLVSPLSSSLSEKSFDGEIKPIAVSSNANLPSLGDGDCEITANRATVQFRRSLKRQEAVVSPTY